MPSLAKLTPEQRLFVEALLATCTPDTIIRKRVREKFGVSQRASGRWIESVIGVLADEARPKTKDQRRAQMRSVFSDFYQKALLARQFNAAVVALDRLCKLDGLYRPEELAVTAAGIDRDPDRVRERIRTLIARTGLAASDAQVAGMVGALPEPEPPEGGPGPDEVN